MKKNPILESEDDEFITNNDEENSDHLTPDEISKLKLMLTLLGRQEDFSYIKRAYEKLRQGKAVINPRERQVLTEFMELFMRSRRAPLRIFINQLH